MEKVDMTESYKFNQGYVQEYILGNHKVVMRKRGNAFLVSTNINRFPTEVYNSLVTARNQYRFLVRSLKLGYV